LAKEVNKEMGWISWIVSVAAGLLVIWVEDMIVNAILDGFHTVLPNDSLLSVIIFLIKALIAIVAAIKVFSLFSSHSSLD
jgi:hypothetical protein